MGACVVEKHFTLDRNDGGVDSAFSLEPEELSQLVEETRRSWESLGSIKYGPTEAEMKSLQYRRSIYVSEDIKAGEAFSPENIKVIRPGDGLKPSLYEYVIGKKARRRLKLGTPLTLEDLES